MATLLLLLIYLFYIGLGIPDSLLGAAWPAIYEQFHVPLSYASVLSVIISSGTAVSSLFSARLIAWLGTAKITALSTVLTAGALLGFSCSQNFLWLCLFAVPLGIGAGSVDTALNNYVALHYNSMQMNFLHCFYGIGVTASPFLMSMALADNMDWQRGYRTVFSIQLFLAVLAVLTLPLWKTGRTARHEEELLCVVPITQMLRRKKALASCAVFGGIGALESTCLIWGSTYLAGPIQLSPDLAAALISFYFVGITLGRFASGLFTLKCSDWQIISGGLLLLSFAVLLLLVQSTPAMAVAALFLVGLGNGPMLPNMTHLTPILFGVRCSQSLIGMEMACYYLSILVTPMVFGMVAERAGAAIFPLFLLATFLVMAGFTAILKLGEAKSRADR